MIKHDNISNAPTGAVALADRITIVMCYWDRDRNDVRSIVDAYMSYRIVHTVVIRERFGGNTLALDENNVRIRVKREPNDLRLRFSGLQGAPTECIYVTDDNHIVSEESLTRLYKNFTSAPMHIHTFYGRDFTYKRKNAVYIARNASRNTKLAIGKSMMVNRRRMGIVSDLLLLRQDELGVLPIGNEDLAFSTLFTLVYETLPKVTKPKDEIHFKSEKTGIHASKDHIRVRYAYLTTFVRIEGIRVFKNNPAPHESSDGGCSSTDTGSRAALAVLTALLLALVVAVIVSTSSLLRHRRRCYLRRIG